MRGRHGGAAATTRMMLKAYLVDDEPLALDRLTRMLEKTGPRRDRRPQHGPRVGARVSLPSIRWTSSSSTSRCRA